MEVEEHESGGRTGQPLPLCLTQLEAVILVARRWTESLSGGRGIARRSAGVVTMEPSAATVSNHSIMPHPFGPRWIVRLK